MAIADDAFLTLFSQQDVFERTRSLLAEYLARGGDIPDDSVRFLGERTLSYVDAIRLGFKWTLRATDAGLAEIRYLLSPADLVDTSAEPSRYNRVVESDSGPIAALQHARVVLSLVPRIPGEQVSYPGRKSYRDIPVPHSPAEFFDRIDEIERSVWDTASRRSTDAIDRNAFRRAYAFWETGALLGQWHIGKFIRRSS